MAQDGKGGFMEIALDPIINRTGDVWHIRVHGLKQLDSLAYGWRADSAHALQFYPGQPHHATECMALQLT